MITTRFIGALWLGLTKPQQVAERIDTIGRSQYEDEIFRAGLKGSAHSREEMLQAALETVRAYEAEREKLQDAPAPLLDYINAQRSSNKRLLVPKPSASVLAMQYCRACGHELIEGA